jgi:hypothetical protein
LTGFTFDQLKLTLDNLLRDSVDPRIPGVVLHRTLRGSEPECLLVRAPKSPLGLHMVTFKGLGRFYGRATSGRYVLDCAQIRDGFVAADVAVERVRSFRREWVVAVMSGETPIPMGTGPKAIFHVLPLMAAADTWTRFPAPPNESDLALNLPTLEAATSLNWRYNIDGFVVHTVRSQVDSQSYTQLFRSGGIETVSPNVVMMRSDMRAFHGRNLEASLIWRMAAYQRVWDTLGVTGPVLAALTLSGMKGAKILAGSAYAFDPEPFTLDLVNIPDLVILDRAMPPQQALKPVIDIVWNGGGWAGSPFYSETGEWNPPK